MPVAIALLAATLLAFGATSARAQDGPTIKIGGNAELGSFLVGPNDMTLYIFTNDTPGESVCFDQCEDELAAAHRR